MKKIISTLAIFTLVVLPMFTFALPVSADANALLWGGQAGNIQANTGLGNEDPRVMASAVINILLGFLGIIAVLIILLGGFKWMTAAGDEGKVDEAKKLIGAGVIGLVVILSAYGLALFIIDKLYTATGAS
ncbi:hypothetical protein A2331_01975 [Candidatus Falkowbacteria bacterium RIFOXYB2_FULL_34_18]|uniref:Uncharacterized protein n=1 Tax=Candidatus Falkowbacteria bacterium RIFOXYD2_FULL_34_120 TaxID=1798007 RepID=A0A1F5TQT9_9BACT|nr:MAG: hypothetical protein A2331_01975 [Candidatus Falkowbacteria bacterium RIFOXYB2_FULL_34_18]OGF38974.1 MAG: hypothetical protein A2515_05460 [Candidatus Falkowbacteria bacterium RIFOXYD12_FULL_34_57]OGF41167.1 MAG: hypothetical protein A2531_01465 [Candidatus Falkowbacteria bacterium RIFOXYD2_FULL_34_120]